MVDEDNTVARLCAAGMAVDGDAIAARALFLEAWESRRDDYDASIAAHFLARHQSEAADALHWNRVAVERAEAVSDDRAKPLLASLYLNLADSLVALGGTAEAAVIVKRGIDGLEYLPPGGYREFVARGLERMKSRIAQAGVTEADS